jgi:hypothetical protein
MQRAVDKIPGLYLTYASIGGGGDPQYASFTDWIDCAQHSSQVAGCCKCPNEISVSIKCKEFIGYKKPTVFSISTLLHVVSWLVGWLVSKLVGWLVGWLVSWLVG